MKYTGETHYSNFLTKLNKKEFVVYSDDYSFEYVDIMLNGVSTWISNKELEMLKKFSISLDKIRNLTYTPGSSSPHGLNNTTKVDGYVVVVEYID